VEVRVLFSAPKKISKTRHCWAKAGIGLGEPFFSLLNKNDILSVLFPLQASKLAPSRQAGSATNDGGQ